MEQNQTDKVRTSYGVGNKLKKSSQILWVISVIVSILSVGISITMSVITESLFLTLYTVIGTIIFLFLCYVSSLILFGIGQLIENTYVIAANTNSLSIVQKRRSNNRPDEEISRSDET